MRRPIDIGNGVSYGQTFAADPGFYKQWGLNGHNGFDFPAPAGTPIYAPEDGTVFIGSNGARDQYTGNRVDGEVVVISGRSYEHWLLHLSQRAVVPGQAVREGTIIGYSGNTGVSSGPHLHWGVRPLQPDVSNGFRGFIDPMTVLNIAPPAPVNPIRLYEAKPAHTLQTNRQPTPWWILNNTTKDINTFKPATQLNIGTPFTVGGVAHHINGEIYAMTPEDFNRAQNGDFSTNNGVNLKDLSPIPVPTSPAPAPQVINTPNIPVPKVTPYTIIPDVLMYFATAEDAKGRKSARGVLSKGSYIELKRDEQAVRIVKNNMDTTIHWVNDFDNKLEEPKADPPVPTLPVDVPAPTYEPVDPPKPEYVPNPNLWKGVQHYLSPDRSPVLFDALNEVEIDIMDLAGQQHAITMPAYNDNKPVPIVSWFEGPDGRKYYRAKKIADNFFWHGIPEHLLQQRGVSKFDRNNDGVVNIEDIFDGISGYVDYGGRFLKTVVTDLRPKVEQAKTKIVRHIDGFRRPK